MSDLYVDWAKVYDCVYLNRTDEVEYWAGQARGYGRRLLDLMCGTAEVSLGLARSGYVVCGVDLSEAMLQVAAERLAAAADYPARRLSLARGDASAIPAANGAFDFVLVGGNGSFSHLGDDLAPGALREMHRVLRPGGGLGMELLNPHLMKEIYPVRKFGPFRPTPGMSLEKTSANRYDRAAGLFYIHQVTAYEIDGEHAEFEVSFALRAWQPDEVRALLEGAGFGNVQFFGSYDLEPFDQWSADLLVAATSA